MVNALAGVIGVCLTIASIKLAYETNRRWKMVRTEGILHELITLICSSICAIIIVVIWGTVHYICH